MTKMSTDFFSFCRYTSNAESVYAIVLVWPTNGTLLLGAPKPSVDTTTVRLLGYPKPFSWTSLSPGGMNITMPTIPFYEMPCQWAWVLKIDGLMNHNYCILEDGDCD